MMFAEALFGEFGLAAIVMAAGSVAGVWIANLISRSRK
jgi:hypothetical protein